MKMDRTAPNPEDQRAPPGDMRALQFATFIDRSKCERVVPLQVLCLGVSRTGTFSLRQALIDLGYKDCYHYTVPMQENPPDAKLWVQALEAKYLGKGKPYTRADWDRLLGSCRAVADTPCVMFYKELLEAYPEAKVILTVRDSADQWLDSMLGTVGPFWDRLMRTSPNPLVRLYRWFTPGDRHLLHMTELVFYNDPVFSAVMRDMDNNTRDAATAYERYNQEIVDLVPKERLLVLNVKEGWKPLCDFLGERVPAYSFPRINDRAVFQHNTSLVADFIGTTAHKNILMTVGAVLAAGVGLAVAAQRYGFFKR